jgi:hypothetical protein
MLHVAPRADILPYGIMAAGQDAAAAAPAAASAMANMLRFNADNGPVCIVLLQQESGVCSTGMQKLTLVRICLAGIHKEGVNTACERTGVEGHRS